MPQTGNFFQDTVKQLQQADALIKNIINKYIVRPTGEVTSYGLGGFVFDVIGDEEMSLDSEITDHFVEENIAIQDHIALRPERFTLKGYVGEVRDLVPFGGLAFLTAIQSLGRVDAYSAEWTTQAAELYSKIAGKIARVGSVISQARSVYDIFLNSDTSATRQQSAFKFFQSVRASRILCDIETPWTTFPDMAIESVRVTQRDDNRQISDFAVTFKQIRFAKRISQTRTGTGGPLSNPSTVLSQYLDHPGEIPKGWEGRADMNLRDYVNVGAEEGFAEARAVQQLLDLPATLQPIAPTVSGGGAGGGGGGGF